MVDPSGSRTLFQGGIPFPLILINPLLNTPATRYHSPLFSSPVPFQPSEPVPFIPPVPLPVLLLPPPQRIATQIRCLYAAIRSFLPSIRRPLRSATALILIGQQTLSHGPQAALRCLPGSFIPSLSPIQTFINKSGNPDPPPCFLSIFAVLPRLTYAPLTPTIDPRASPVSG